MKIKNIEFENFRNFKEHGRIECSCDGKFTIVYGDNGSGKTTLHQLFQWIMYGETKFNKTATDKLYNFEYEKEQQYNSSFDVWGKIEFEHDKTMYSVKRVVHYKKGMDSSIRTGDEFVLQRMDDDYNWLTLNNPKDKIDQILPSGLSEYFFFDGESMIADLQVKGQQSANKLKKSLYSLFDLDILKAAFDRIGNEDTKTSIIGSINLSRVDSSSDEKAINVKSELTKCQDEVTIHTKEIEKEKQEFDEINRIITELSERIGTTKSREEYNSERKKLQNQRDHYYDSVSDSYYRFGEMVDDEFPKILISKAIEQAKNKLNLKIENEKLPRGINKDLIAYLLDKNTDTCICGNKLSAKEKDKINSYLSQLPPYSYKGVYDQFSSRVDIWGKNYDVEAFNSLIYKAASNYDNAKKCDSDIEKLDENYKQADKNIDKLIDDRRNAEVRRDSVNTAIVKSSSFLQIAEAGVRKSLREFERVTNNSALNERINNKIEIMKTVKAHFGDVLDERSETYSTKLQEEIQELLNEMLTSERTVRVSKDFLVRIVDNYDDESKSGGQFAVASFAYIGGILNLMKKEETLNGKEYPLVLDGPFSKLDVDQKRNVIKALPVFAPQVVILSKDDLSDFVDPDVVGNVYTITTNAAKNVAKVEEGYVYGNNN